MKKSSIILSLLTLTLALATLPALGDLNYLKETYNYLEKIPIKQISSYTNNTGRETQKLLDNNKNTEWISWKENVIWEEDYTQSHNYTTMAIDGANKTVSTLNNNTLSIAEIPQSNTPSNPTSRPWRQYRIFEASQNSQLATLKAGTYKLKLKYRGTIASSGDNNRINVFFGDYDGEDESGNVIKRGQQISIGVPTEWTEEEITFNLPIDITNGFCCVQPGTYPGIIEVESAELSYESTEVSSGTNLIINYEGYEGVDSYPYDSTHEWGPASLFLEDGALVASRTDGDWWQVALTDNINVVQGTNYRARLRIKGTKSAAMKLWWGYDLDGDNKRIDVAYSFNIPQSDTDVLSLPLGVCPRNNNDIQISLQPGNYDGTIEVKQFILEYEDGPGNWVEYKNVVYQDFQKYPKNTRDNKLEYIPALVTDGGKVVAKITNPNYTDSDVAYNGTKRIYQFRLAHGYTLPADTYTVKFRIKADTEDDLSLLFGSENEFVAKSIRLHDTGNEYEELEIKNLKLKGGNECWIICQPNEGYEGNFSVESIEYIGETPIDTSWTITNDGTYFSANEDLQKSEDGVIYSYPLPTTRKVIVGGGNGLNLQNGQTYTVTYNIKSANGGKVTTLLAQDYDLNNVSNSNADWNTTNAVATGKEIDLQPGVVTSVRTSLTPSNYVSNGFVVLDLGYNPRNVEITDLKVLNNYDPSITTHEAKKNNLTTKDGDVFYSEENSIYTLFYVCQGNLSLNSKKNYKVKVRMRGSEPGKLCVKLGEVYSWNPGGRMVHWKNFEGNNVWNELTFDFSDANQNPAVNMSNGNLLLQVQKQTATEDEDGVNQYGGTIDVEWVKLYHVDSNGYESESIDWDFKNGYSYGALGDAALVSIEDGKLVSTLNTDKGDWYQFWIKQDIPLQRGRAYRLYTTLKGDNAKTNGINVQFGGWNPNMLVNTMNIPASMGEEYVDFNYAPLDNNFIIFQLFGSNTDKIIYDKFSLVPTETLDAYVNFKDANAVVPNGVQDGYKNMTLTGDGLHVEPQGKPQPLLENQNIQFGKSYLAEFDINVSHAGSYLLTLGDEKEVSTAEITIATEEAGKSVRKEAVFNMTPTTNAAKLTIQPLATPLEYTQTLDVDNLVFSEYSPAYGNGDVIGTDFFEVELGDNTRQFNLDEEGRYLFHIGYEPEGNGGVEATPKKFLVYGGSSASGDFKKLGSYDVTDWNNGNAFISTVNQPLTNIADDIKFLRFYCAVNEGGVSGICFPKENGNYNTERAYVGSMIRMTRFGIYKQSTMFATDKADPSIGTALNEETYEKYSKWAMPMLTRFQIEALGKKYAYPGATFNDMIGVKKSAEICGELFDNDYVGNQYPRTTYWDTTLPFLKDMNRGDGSDGYQDTYQYIDYANFEYPEEYDGKRDYDCIDLLLPKFEDLGVVKKLNGKIDENGYYQLVVSMKRSTGYLDDYNNRIIYDGETAEFRNRANGFPIEISYKGLMLDDKHNKTLEDIDLTERVLTFPSVAAGDSIQFALKIEKGWNGVRIFCRENTGNLQRRPGGTKTTNDAATKEREVRVVDVVHNTPAEGVDLSNTRIMRLGEIRAYVELNKINLESDAGKATYDLLYNCREDFNSRGWKHTQGIIADINNFNTVNGSTGDKYMIKAPGGQTWEDVMDDYKDFFDAQGIAYPDFSFITNPFDDEDVVPSNGTKRDKTKYKGQRQRTYTILHEVLALPGERVDLYPQSDIWQSNGFNYEEQFVRWYDYLTDKTPDYLYFFAEPKSVIKTQNAGFIGGKTLLDHGLRGKGTVASIYYDETARKNFEEKLKNNPNEVDDRYYYDNVYKTVRIMDNWVAADFSLAFNTNLAERLGLEKDSWKSTGSNIQEPIINFRHLFHITSGSLFADRYMSTAEGNQHYAKSNRRYISTFANKTFRIRLEQAMPVDASTKSAFYYKTNKGEYKRVLGYDIRTYKLNDGEKSDERVAGINLSNLGTNDTGIFGIDNSSTFDHIDSYVQTTTDQSKWLRNSKKFARSIVCDRTNAEKGRYLVRLYGKDESGNVIGLNSTEAGNTEVKPLVIAEYEIEFMGEEYASFKSEEFLNNLSGKDVDTYGHHTETYLEEHYGNGKSDVKTVNFDKYMLLNSESVVVNKGSAPVNFKRFGFFEEDVPGFWGSDKTGTHVNYQLNDKVSRMKMPITWGDSNYGFGYQITGDYNMFRLASHSLMTPYMSAASTRGVDLETDYVNDNGDKYHKMVGETLKWVEYDDDGNAIEKEKANVQGTYDRLYYNTHGEQQGLFYYVNAAADPGEMVKIDFDYLCPGSTIYVSAWVNEFNHAQPETANVIFNFYANVAKTDEETGEKVILRQEQIHGFSTGYVNRNKDGFDESNERIGGDQGKWMHVYYTFVPDETHADIDKSEGEYIDSYYLVLENNCLSSEGADYAVDDIRAYVIAPRVDARQSNSLCEKNDVKIDIQVELPLEALEQSLLDLADKDGKVTLQYSIVDKIVYDNVLKDKEEAFNKTQENEENPKKYEPSAEDYREAFVAGVLHYKHTNVMSDNKDEEGNSKVEYPISWGEIEFYMDYDNIKYKKADGTYDETLVITGADGMPLKINGKTWTLGEYKEEYLKDIYEKCFVFTTHPVSDPSDYNEFVQTHREYYVVVGNFETKGLFTSIGEDQKDKYNADVYPYNEANGVYGKSTDWSKYDDDLAIAYQIGSDCARMAEFSLKGSAQIVIDGVLHETDDNITCCENQRPVIQLNLKTRHEDKNGNVLYDDVKDGNELNLVNGSEYSENPYLDWYYGSFEDFADEKSTIKDNDGEYLTLWDILDDFRTDYPDADTWDMPVAGEKDANGNLLPTGKEDADGNPIFPLKYTSAMREYLKELCATSKVDETTKETVPVEPIKLVLHQSSYVFPQSATILVENGKKVNSKDIYVTAIPPATPTEVPGEDDTVYVICTQPREVKITVSNTSPTLFNGFMGIKYPETIEDVPLRVGLKQLDNIVGSSTNDLYVPLRNVNPATYDVEEFKRFGDDNYVYLVETNDPNYRKLSDHDKIDDKDPKDTYNVETRVVGKVTSLTVNFKRNDDSGDLEIKGTPMAQVVFDTESSGTQVTGDKLGNGITFREGYYYKFRFFFEEGETKMSGQEGYEMPCNGQTVFSIKVVPEYQIWTGDTSLNWNNDDNWRRVSSEDLLANVANNLHNQAAGDGRFTTDVEIVDKNDSDITDNDDPETVGENNPKYENPNSRSYAPLDFTKVIIPAGATYPQLAARQFSRQDNDASTISVNNGKKDDDYVWQKVTETVTDNTPKAVTAAGSGNDSSVVGASASESYQPTLYIQYDMAATTYSDDQNVYCRPWYANACEQIHFNSNAEILNQQNLDYEKAWVDMEMKPHRWYTAASPLYGVVAGDMYLPAKKESNTIPGRQMTELFTPIEYKQNLNDRFAPAVYQRGWDKGTETVYTVHNTSTEDTETVALASTWSHVYNDVTEEYAPGVGYSVKTDVTRLTNFQSTKNTEGETVTETPAEQTYVKFRFPKADTEFNYFEDGNAAAGETNHRELTRTKAGRLFEGTETEVTLTKQTSGNLFLVGNPFMAHLDMAKFLEVNADVSTGTIGNKFWLLTETEQVAAVLNGGNESTILASNGSDVTQLAPMQGFFVQAKTAGTSLAIKFTPDMMAVKAYTDTEKKPILKAPAVRAVDEDIIRVSTPASAAIIRLTPAADKGYAASEDVEMIDDSNQRGLRRIYTVAGTMASAINQTPDADGVEVGLMAPADSLTVVTFNGVALEDYLLYDTATGEMTQLYDGFELEMEGSVSGRYFLTAGIDTAEIEDGTIRIMPAGHEVVVTAPAVCGEMTVRVFDTLGREVAKAEGMAQEVRIPLDPGIYAVEAVGADAGRKSAKVQIR